VRTFVLTGKAVHSAKFSKKELASKIDMGGKTGTLSLSAATLSTVPDAVFALELRKLDVSHNAIVAFPPQLTVMGKLRNLDFSANQLAVLPSSIGAMVSLQIVRVVTHRCAASASH
jgi:Leucine-rich repeat (LRR) protein